VNAICDINIKVLNLLTQIYNIVKQLYYSRIFIFFIFLLSIVGCKKDIEQSSIAQVPNSVDSTLPILTTGEANTITNNSAVVGGNIVYGGGFSIVSRGVCFSTHPNPTIADIRINNGQGVGQFSCSLSSLNSNITYYAKAFAVTNNGVGYGNEITFNTLGSAIPYVPDPASSIYVGGSDTLYHINAANGSLIWKRKLDTTINSISYTNGKVFIACSNNSSSKLYCYDILGNVIWTKTLTELIRSEVLSYKEYVYYSTPSGLYCLDGLTGYTHWQILGNCGYTSMPEKITIANDNIYIRSPSTCSLVSLNYQSGNQNWSQSTGFSGRLMVSNGTIYAFGGSSLGAFEELNGANKWIRDYANSENNSSISLGLGNIYLGYPSTNSLDARDTIDGAIKWQVNFVPQTLLNLTPIIDDTLLIIGKRYSVVVLNANSGNAISDNYNGYSMIFKNVSVAAKIIYRAITTSIPTSFPSGAGIGRVDAINAQNGNIIWTSTEKSDFRNTPCIVTVSGKMHRGNEIY
jgi:hypothetical protein